MHEFLAIVTHPRNFTPPTPTASALDQVDAWLESRSVTLLTEGPTHWPALRALVLAGLIGCTGGTPVATEPDTPTPIPTPIDEDGDGWSPPEDCDDHAELVHPGSRWAVEFPCLRDFDCDGRIDGAYDEDGDGWTTCHWQECDDANPDAWFGAPDPLGDGVDQDCDGTDGVGLELDPWIEGQTHAYALAQEMVTADVDGDGCADLITGESGFVTWQMGLATGQSQGRLFAHLGCRDPAEVRVLQADIWTQGIAAELDVWRRPGGDAIVSSSRSTDRGARVIEFGEVPAITSRVVAEAPGDLHHQAVVHRGGGAQLVATRIHGLNAGPALGFDLPFGGATWSSPDDVWVPDPDPEIVGWRTLAIDRTGEGDEELLISSYDPLNRDGIVYVLDGPGTLDDAVEVWHGGAALGESFGGQMFRVPGLFPGEAETLLVGAVSMSQFRGALYVVPALGPGVYGPEHLGASFHGEAHGDHFGYSAAAGDVNGDGHRDLVIGAPGVIQIYSPNRGRVYVFLGPFEPGRAYTRLDAHHVFVGQRHDWMTLSLGDVLGSSVAVLDLDGDGIDEIYAGAPGRPGFDETGEMLPMFGAIYRLPLE